MSAPDEHKMFQYKELRKVDDALDTLRKLGISELDPAYTALNKARATALGKLGLIQPRTTTLVSAISGLSPGEIRLFQDAERGWMIEAIEKPGATPTFRYVSNEIAEKILKDELTHEEFSALIEFEEEYIA